MARDGVDDVIPALGLAERLRAEQPKDAMVMTTLGAMLYRAGRFKEAAQQLSKAERLSPNTRTSPIYSWFFLAMAHHRLGQNDEARRWFEQAMSATERALASHERGVDVLPLQRRLTLTLLRSEAAALLGVVQLPDDVFAPP